MTIRYEQKQIQNPHVFGSMNTYPNQANFHERTKNLPPSLNNNFLLGQSSPIKIYPSLNLDNGINQPPNNKQSHARNFKNRLFEGDPLQEIKKEMQKVSYKQQLQQQMKADKERKKREKQQIQKEELERERKFYAQIKQIKAQAPKLKEQPSYMIMRSRKGDRMKIKSGLDHSRSLNAKTGTDHAEVHEFHMPKIMKRGGYHNQSTLDNLPSTSSNPQDNPQLLSLTNLKNQPGLPPSRIKPSYHTQSQLQQRQIQIAKQRDYEQQRITNIIRLQQKMIRKLEFFKQQILKSNNHFKPEQEVQQIRNILKAKPIKLQVWSVKNDEIFNNNSDFYHVESRVEKARTRARNRGSPQRNHKSRIQQGINLNDQPDQTQQNYQNIQRTLTEEHQPETFSNNSIRKREIKLFRPSDDKNYYEVNKENQNEENPQNSVPVLLRNRNVERNRVQQQQDQNQQQEE